jgi:hypothetical protein
MRPSAIAERNRAIGPSCPIISLKYTSIYLLIGLVCFIMCGLYGHTLHLNEPPGAAHGSKEVYFGNGGETLLEHLFHYGIVSDIAQVNDEVPYVFEGTLGLGKECLYVLPHALGLTTYVARVHDLATVVDASRARDKNMAAVTIVYIGATLKAHSILVGGVEVCGGIEVVYLIGLQTVDSIGIHLYQNLVVGMATGNTCTSDEMGLFCKILSQEHLVASLHNTSVVDIHVLHEEPSADTVVGQRAALLGKAHHIVAQQEAGLILRLRCFVVVLGRPDVAIASVTHLVVSMGQGTRVHLGL